MNTPNIMNSGNIKIHNNLTPTPRCATWEKHPIEEDTTQCRFAAAFTITFDDMYLDMCQFHALDSIHSFLDQGVAFSVKCLQ